jgi:hypothetical protein
MRCRSGEKSTSTVGHSKIDVTTEIPHAASQNTPLNPL